MFNKSLISVEHNYSENMVFDGLDLIKILSYRSMTDLQQNKMYSNSIS